MSPLDVAGVLEAYDTGPRCSPIVPRGARLERDGPLLRVLASDRVRLIAPRDPGLSGAELDRLIRRQTACCEALGVAVEWKRRGHDLPLDLGDRLEAAGFVAGARDTMLAARASALAAGARPPDGIELRRVVSLADMRRIAALWSAVSSIDRAMLADHLAGVLGAAPEDALVLVAEAGGELVSAGWLICWRGTGLADLRGGVTASAWRGRGVYRALVAERAREAVERGVSWLLVEASSESAPILRRLGFGELTSVTPYEWQPVR